MIAATTVAPGFCRATAGEVVAEAVESAEMSFLGLRFPASDIPAQARAMYDREPIRVIPDVADTIIQQLG